MHLHHIDHFTLRVAPHELPPLLDFYRRVLGFTEGARPDFSFPGHWLYCDGKPLVHLAGNAPANETPVGPGMPTGKLNHVSLRASGLATTRAHLKANGVVWQEAPVPGMPLHQVFLHDPAGLQIELTFDATECDRAGPLA
jgi:catechol 2,3-dioxygenase-like lactoylglutathione lyase family enzyme